MTITQMYGKPLFHAKIQSPLDGFKKKVITGGHRVKGFWAYNDIPGTHQNVLNIINISFTPFPKIMYVLNTYHFL